MKTGARRVVAGRGLELRCLGWRQEALLRMLENALELAEDPERLIVYASLGKAARDWDAFETIVEILERLADDETLLLQSGRPVGVFPTSASSPMVLSACSNFVGQWQTPERFYELASRGLTMWGGLTAGAWQYIGSQGVLQGTYELLQRVGVEHFSGDLNGRWLLTSGLGGMGSSQPLAASMSKMSSLVVEADPAKVDKSRRRGLLDHVTGSLDEAIQLVTGVHGQPVSVALIANSADVYPAIVERSVVPDVVTDQTAAHDLRYGYIPPGLSRQEWLGLQKSDPRRVEDAARAGIATQVQAMLTLQQRGAIVFENGNNLRVHASEGGVASAFEIRGFMERYLRPLFCQGIGPFRWVALSGDVADLHRLDEIAAGIAPARPEVAAWIGLVQSKVPVEGLPARSCWLGHGERSAMALAANREVESGRISAPVLFTRDHLDSAGMTHPRIGTENMADGSDGISDWPILDALLLASSSADLVAVHAGGGGYAGWMQSAGVSVVADGTSDAATRVARALDADTGLGVIRYAEAGYDLARRTAAEGSHGIRWATAPVVRGPEEREGR